MKKIAIVAGVVVGLGGGALGIGAAQHNPTYPPGTMVGPVPVSGLDSEQAAKRLRIWWDSERSQTIAISGPKVDGLPKEAKWAELGLKLDDAASVAQLQLETFWDSAGRSIGMQEAPLKVQPVFTIDTNRYERYADIIKKASANRKPANAQWNGKQVIFKYEVAPMTLNAEALGEAAIQAWQDKSPEIELPTMADQKAVPDESLEKIKEQVVTFTTKFPTYKVTRCQNIELAAKLLDGLVLMPGESFSFNGFLGPRTTAKGFKVAGVFANGRHDVGVGGGICQVSTTIYNAVALAGLKITQRSNHSMAVTYVPVGRDAAVSYPNPDLKFTNSFDFPVALDTVYSKGQLTASILGIKDKSVEITIERGPVSTWGRGVKVQNDPSLPYGRSRVIDAGGAAHKTVTYRVFRKNGKVVKREVLHVSQYPGSPRLIGRNLSARPKPKPAVQGPVAVPVAPPTE